METTLIAAGAGVLGLLVGSFVNVVVWRVPRGESVVAPRSRCPDCEATLRPSENVPVVSWLAQRGRCRHCGAAVSVRYPAIELLTALAFAAVGAAFADDPLALPAYLTLTAMLVAVSAIDLEHLIIPNRIVYPVGFASVPLLALAAAGDRGWGALARAGAGALVYFGTFYALWWLVRGRALGFGDVRLAFVLGGYLAFLGWGALAAGMFGPFLVGSLLGILVVVPVLVLPMLAGAVLGWVLGLDLAEVVAGVVDPAEPGRVRAAAAAVTAVLVGSTCYLVLSALRRVPRGRQIPFGPSMAVAAWLVVLVAAGT